MTTGLIPVLNVAPTTKNALARTRGTAAHLAPIYVSLGVPDTASLAVCAFVIRDELVLVRT